jgi:O-antigen/teichoic acid export membrane protein
MSNLKQKTILNMIWSVTEQVSVQILQIIISIILGRLLSPSDFGLLGMITVFSSVAQSIVYSGFGSALIQKKDIDETDASSVFYFNIFMGFVLSATLFLFAPLIAKFFNQPILIQITRAMSLIILINSFSLVQRSLMMRELNFRLHLIIEFIAVLLSGIAGIVMALNDMGVWSLVIQLISRYLISTILLWLLSNWRPSLLFSYQSIESMFSFGSKLLISEIINTVFNNIYQTFIGKVYSVKDLGYYKKAITIESAAANTTTLPFSKVIFVTLSPFQENNRLLKQSYRKTIKLSMFLHFPIMIGLITIADPLIRLLLTDKWAPSIPFFQLLCVVGVFMPLDYYNNVLFKIKGRSDLYLQLEIIKKLLTILAIFITYRWSIIALLVGQIIVSVITIVINSFFSNRLIQYSLKNQIADLFSSFLTASLMGIGLYLLSTITYDLLIVELLVLIIGGILIYSGINVIIKSPEFSEIWSILNNVFSSIRKRVINS